MANFNHAQCKDGKRRTFVTTGNYVQGVRVALPVLTVKGRREGPVAVIMAGQHGTELNGVAAIARVFEQLDPEEMAGTVVFLPVMNPIGARVHHGSCFADGSDDLNRAWRDEPASQQRSCAHEIAATVWETFLKHADWMLDLHCCRWFMLPHAYAAKKDLPMLRAFGIPCCRLTATPDVPSCPGMAMSWAATHGIPALIGELPSSHTLENESVTLGERGIMNLLKFTGMLPGEPEVPEYQYVFVEKDEGGYDRIDAVTPVEGLAVTDFRGGDMVCRGQIVVRVLSLETLSVAWEFPAPDDALILTAGIGVGQHGEFDRVPVSSLAHSGETVAWLAAPRHIIRNDRDQDQSAFHQNMDLDLDS